MNVVLWARVSLSVGTNWNRPLHFGLLYTLAS